jgi:hypothetical protein
MAKVSSRQFMALGVPRREAKRWKKQARKLPGTIVTPGRTKKGKAQPDVIAKPRPLAPGQQYTFSLSQDTGKKVKPGKARKVLLDAGADATEAKIMTTDADP